MAGIRAVTVGPDQLDKLTELLALVGTLWVPRTWVAQQARNLLMDLGEHVSRFRS